MLGPCILAAALAGACQSAAPPEPSDSGKSAALRTMERIAKAAQRCWFVAGDPAFKPFAMADELNSFSGRPRILLVPARDPQARPLLVAQAQGSPVRLELFGPLMDGPQAQRIAADVRRWADGASDCRAA